MILIFSFDIKQSKHNQFIVAIAQNIYLLRLAISIKFCHPKHSQALDRPLAANSTAASLTLPTLIIYLACFYNSTQSDHKHSGYNEANPGYTTVSTTDFKITTYLSQFLHKHILGHPLLFYWHYNIQLACFIKETTNIWGITRRQKKPPNIYI